MWHPTLLWPVGVGGSWRRFTHNTLHSRRAVLVGHWGCQCDSLSGRHSFTFGVVGCAVPGLGAGAGELDLLMPTHLYVHVCLVGGPGPGPGRRGAQDLNGPCGPIGNWWRGGQRHHFQRCRLGIRTTTLGGHGARSTGDRISLAHKVAAATRSHQFCMCSCVSEFAHVPGQRQALSQSTQGLTGSPAEVPIQRSACLQDVPFKTPH